MGFRIKFYPRCPSHRTSFYHTRDEGNVLICQPRPQTRRKSEITICSFIIKNYCYLYSYHTRPPVINGLLGTSPPTRATQIPIFSCLLSDVGVTTMMMMILDLSPLISDILVITAELALLHLLRSHGQRQKCLAFDLARDDVDFVLHVVHMSHDILRHDSWPARLIPFIEQERCKHLEERNCLNYAMN